MTEQNETPLAPSIEAPNPKPSPPIFVAEDEARIRAVFPEEMLARPQWVAFRMRWLADKGKFTKIPVNPHTGYSAQTNNSDTWSAFDLAVKRAFQSRLSGVGFVLDASDPYVGVDLDSSLSENGEWDPQAQEIIDELRSYTEWSPSGKGCHIFGRGVLPPGGRRMGNIEMYDSRRFLTVTGRKIGEANLRDFQAELDAVHTRVFDRENKKRSESTRDFQDIAFPALSDAEVIEKATNAENGAKFTALWRGDWQAFSYPSTSEADLALCNIIAWYVNHDPVRVDALFRQSGLFRPEKWDQLHYADGRTYGQETVKKAVANPESGKGFKPSDRSKHREPNRSLNNCITIAVNQQLKKILEESWDLVHQVNRDAGGPSLFKRAGTLVRIRQDDDTPPYISPQSKEDITTFLFKRAEWVVWGEKAFKPSKPQPNVVDAMLCEPDPGLPRLAGISTVPFLSVDGRLILSDGYHPQDFIWLKISDSLKGLNVPEHPSPEEIQAAVDFIFRELLIDFPFADQSDRAHALAAFLLPFVRPMIRGSTPLHLIEAPTPGSGKTLLANLIGIIVTDEDLPAQTLPQEEEEIRKRLTSILRRAPSIVLLDNVTQKTRVESSALCAVLTTSDWEDRLLGVNEDIHSKNNSIWLMTGNNPRMSMEIASRTIRIRLDPHVEEPWEREGFRHEDIRTWTREHRRDIVQALLTMVTGWLAAGQPFHGKRLGRFEQWTTVIGGILQNAEVEGFLANRKQLYKQVDDESTTWQEFIEQWWAVFHETPVQVRQLNDLCEEQDMMVRLRGEGSARSQATRLGTALRRMRDAVKAGYRIHVDVTLKNASGNYRNNGYRLTKAEDVSFKAQEPELQFIEEDTSSLDEISLTDELPF